MHPFHCTIFNGGDLHEVLCLAGSVATLLADGIVAKLAILEDTLHLDDTTPPAHENLGSFTVSVL